MLYLNTPDDIKQVNVYNLTLTSVVFELNKEDIIDINPENLTLTSVVFE